MSNLCSDSVLTGQEGTILFTPPGTSVCVRDWSPFVTTSNRIYLQCGSAFVVGDKVKLTEEDGGNLDGGLTDGKEETVSAVGTGASGDENAAGDDMEGVPFIVLDGITIAGDGGVTIAGVLTTGGMGAITAGSGGTDGTYENVKLTSSGAGTGATLGMLPFIWSICSRKRHLSSNGLCSNCDSLQSPLNYFFAFLQQPGRCKDLGGTAAFAATEVSAATAIGRQQRPQILKSYIIPA